MEAFEFFDLGEIPSLPETDKFERRLPPKSQTTVKIQDRIHKFRSPFPSRQSGIDIDMLRV